MTDGEIEARAREAFRSVFRLFSYTPDTSVDTWQSHIASVMEGRRFSGDCEDFAMTAGAMCSRLGIGADRIRLWVGRDETGSGHAVCLVETGAAYLALDNRMTAVTTWGALERRGYVGVQSKLLSGGPWLAWGA